MNAPQAPGEPGSSPGEAADADIFVSAEMYDRSINWDARIKREIPLLAGVFGPPGPGGLLDAGCGTGRQTVALAGHAYQMTGADLSAEMLDLAVRHAADRGAEVSFVCCPFAELSDRLRPGFDGVYCIGNSLAAAGTAAAADQAIGAFAHLLRPGGALCLQVLNFPALRDLSPCVKGPRVALAGGIEYVSVRTFHFVPAASAGPQGRVEVTNVTLWNDGGWRQRSHSGNLYPLTSDELIGWCRAAGLQIVETLGGYDRTPFDRASSADLLLIARKTA